MKKFNKILIGVIILLLVGIMFITTPEKTQEGHWAVDYVTPDCEVVAQYTEDILGVSYNGYLTSQDVYALQYWIAENVKYQTEIPEYPKETLTDRTGNCFSMCSTLLSMILNEDSSAKSFMLLVNITIEDSDEVHRHSVILTVFENDLAIISDPTVGAPEVEKVSPLLPTNKILKNIFDTTTIVTFDVTQAVSLEEYWVFENNQDFLDFIGRL